MRAAVIDRFGDPGELHLASAGDPPLARGQVRVWVITTGAGATDAITRAGGLADAALNLAAPQSSGAPDVPGPAAVPAGIWPARMITVSS
ncbi:MAG TPA: hypothetical protein VF070_19900 [Streptosporangiaceae bacterium]